MIFSLKFPQLLNFRLQCSFLPKMQYFCKIFASSAFFEFRVRVEFRILSYVAWHLRFYQLETQRILPQKNQGPQKKLKGFYQLRDLTRNTRTPTFFRIETRFDDSPINAFVKIEIHIRFRTIPEAISKKFGSTEHKFGRNKIVRSALALIKELQTVYTLKELLKSPIIASNSDKTLIIETVKIVNETGH